MACGIMFGCTTSVDLEWQDEGDYRWAVLEPGYWGHTGFESLSSGETNIHFENRISKEEITENRHYLNGSGVTAGDVDGDGLVDLYFVGLQSSNRLYKNLGGMQFEDITEKAGVAHEGYYSTGAVFADVNGNGHLDLLITAMHKDNVLYINDGTGHFELKENSGLGSANGSMTMTLADIDGDRDLDLYITNYKEKSVKDIYTSEQLEWENILNEEYNERQQTGPYTLTPPFDEHYRIFMTEENRLAGVAEVGTEDELYINVGEETFKKVRETESVFLDEKGEANGLQPDWGLAAKFQDLNDDGLPDLYVANDFFPPDRIWINQGNGTFKAIEWPALRNMSYSSMAVDFSDINRDGELDIFVTEMLSPEHDRRLRQMGADDPTPNRTDMIESRPQYNRNSMYLKREDDTYSEIAYLSGTEASEWSWATRFMDINLDGYEDLIINTGYTYDILDIDSQAGMIRRRLNMDEHFDELINNAPPLDLPNKMFINNGDLSFDDKSQDWGFDEDDVSHGLATADLDNDGDLDFVTNRLNKTAAVYENRTTAARIAVRLKGLEPNTRGIGAKIRLKGGSQVQMHEISAGGDYLSGSDQVVMFAACADCPDHTVEVTWPNGKYSVIDNVKANRIYEIRESGAQSDEPVNRGKRPGENTLFEDISDRIGHHHRENTFDDFGLQPLLPLKLSQLGPGTAWIDIDNDGDDDLFVASGKGGAMGAFENLGDGSFSPIESFPFNETSAGDQTSIIGWSTTEDVNLVVGSANYEQGDPRAPAAFRYRLRDKETLQTDSLSNLSTTGAISAADYDYDGDLDLFVGGRFVPAHYPREATSRLYKNEQGNFVLDHRNSQQLNKIGLITGSVFTDYDQDGDPDLLLSREWGPIILLENIGGSFQNVSEKVGLSDLKGWWNGVATGDFTNNGYPDIIATNIGLNSVYQLNDNRPLRMYYDDFNGDNRVDIIEAYGIGEGEYVPRHRMFKYNSLPTIVNQMNSYSQFASSSLHDIFGDRLSRIPYKEVNTLEHLLFVNTGSGFEARPLPVEAQFSAAFDAGVADFDNDGNEDIFLSQNFFGFPREVPRLDSGRGLWLKGNGKGNFIPVNGSRSGIKIYGEQRGAAFSDFNRDGKVDLVVSQNNAETKLYLNRADESGYRISLLGSGQNKDGVGSTVRLVYSDGEKGPIREIQSGSGYWSQNSFTQILGTKHGKEVRSIEIRWYDGSKQTVNVVNGQKEYQISHSEGTK